MPVDEWPMDFASRSRQVAHRPRAADRRAPFICPPGLSRSNHLMVRTTRARALCAALVGVLAVPAAASADKLYVNHVASPAAKGNSCETAKYSSVQTAVTAAKKGSQIYLCGSDPYV